MTDPTIRERLRERHQIDYTNTVSRYGFKALCDSDRQAWPCDTVRVLDEFDTLERRVLAAEKALRTIRDATKPARGLAGTSAHVYEIARAALANLPADRVAPEHRHRYGLVPVWKADRSEVESWWWCTDHPAGEWVKIEDEPDGPIAPSPPETRDAVQAAISILEHTSDHHATDARLTLLAARLAETPTTEAS